MGDSPCLHASIYAIRAVIVDKKNQLSFSPHSLQKTASAKFSLPQLGQNFFVGFSATA
jgi:hypothetical protein